MLFLKSMLYFAVIIVKYKKYSKPIGFRILVAGRFNGQSRSKIKQLRVGSLGLQSVKNNIDFHKCCCLTKFGSFGIKVWINHL
jgi:ribosomal protein S3